MNQCSSVREGLLSFRKRDLEQGKGTAAAGCGEHKLRDDLHSGRTGCGSRHARVLRDPVVPQPAATVPFVNLLG